MRELVLKGRAIVEGCCRGEALVSLKPLSFLGGVDPANGVIVDKEHDLYGESVKGKILCFPHGHGSTVGSYVIYALAKKGFAPKAIVNKKIDPVIVVGAVIAEIPMIAEVDIQQIATGDIVDVDACSGVVKILKGKE
jgi:predicted aconitase with swiveling domain